MSFYEVTIFDGIYPKRNVATNIPKDMHITAID
jgi:hypothetical protein